MLEMFRQGLKKVQVGIKQLDRLLYFISYYFISQEKFYILILRYKFPHIIKDPQYSRTLSGTLEKHATMVKEQGSGFCKN